MPIPKDEYPGAFEAYVSLVPESDILPALERQLALLRTLGAAVPAARETFAYAPGKWTIRELVGHLGDGERVFGFRAFSFGRGDREPLPGFDENFYVANARSGELPLADLLAELCALRESNLLMLRGLRPERWSNLGVANGKHVTVRALAHVMVGHLRHHLGVLRERYGVAVPD